MSEWDALPLEEAAPSPLRTVSGWLEWERVAHMVAAEAAERGLVMVIDEPPAGFDDAQDFWRGWIAWVADPAMAALADARVTNPDAYAAGALARAIYE